MQVTANCSRNAYAVSVPIVLVPTGPQQMLPAGFQWTRQQKAWWLPTKTLRIMKLSTIFLLAFFLHVSAKTTSQTVTLTGNNLPIKEVFKIVEQQTGYFVWGKTDFLEKAKPVSLTVRNMPLTDFLTRVMKDQPFTYKIKDKTIILSEKAGDSNDKPATIMAPPPTDNRFLINISGFLFNGENSKPIEGANITVKGSKQGTSSDATGRFTLTGLDENAVMIISCIGYSTVEVALSRLSGVEMNANLILTGGSAKKLANDVYTFRITPASTTMGEVVINTGVYKRNKESFTGAASVYSGAELKTIGNKNILESLRTLDPAFLKIDNNLSGSNPNKLPEFEIRGRTSISTANLNDQFNADPNQPLFILDGFESTLKAIYDLDMNRVASVTILKDAASTALYGAKAANGVVVVETKRPIPGRLQVNYTADLSMDLPDLSSYNLMNASEKLQYEKLANVNGTMSGDQQWKYDEQMSYRQAEIQRGVNTYWLSEPVRKGFTNRHSLQLAGGNNDLQFGAGVSYSNQDGVMKGSGRDNWGTNINLSYRKGQLNIVNLMSATGGTANESPYGSFSVFAQTSPYYRKTNPDGTINKLLDPVYNPTLVNPLYNASLFSINQTKTFSFTNNTQAIFTINNALRLQGGLQFTRGNTNAVVFIPPDNSTYDNIEAKQKGSYTSNQGNANSWGGNLMLTWAKLFGRHQLNANARTEIAGTLSDAAGFSAVGYPYGTNGNPAYAYSYTPFTTPSSTVTKTRSVGFLGSVNYAYGQRYMMDLTYRIDGASVFGSSKVYKPFFSAGLAWNIGREAFIQQLKWVSMLKIRGDVGYTGNENLGQFSSVSTYTFLTTNNNNFGQGLTVGTLGNPLLDWQKTLQESYGIDFAFLKSRISGFVEYYRKRTDPLAVGADGTLPSSVGVNSGYVINVGYLTTKGYNFNLRLSPVYDLKKRIIWTIGVTGSNYTSKYGGFADKLATLNKQQQQSNGLTRYYDGYSPDDVWAVVSRGVDPATGQEVFQKKDGSLTFNYDPADIVKVGNTRPQTEGIISTSFTYKNFSMGGNIRYLLNGYVFNSALYSKVENVGGTGVVTNLDKRALYDRWQKPGDIAQFTAIGSGSTPMSSRFLQKDSHFMGESFNVSWRSSGGWVRDLKLQSLGVTFYLNDIFRLQKVLTERGIDYPYARTASFSLNVSF